MLWQQSGERLHNLPKPLSVLKGIVVKAAISESPPGSARELVSLVNQLLGPLE